MNAPAPTNQFRISEFARNRWFAPAGIAIACVVALCLIFHEEAAGALHVWLGSATYNHCFLIAPIALYMIWQRRGSLATVDPKPSLRAAFLIPLLSLGWFAASIFGVLEAQQFAALTILQAVLFVVLGGAVYRRLLAPFLYLYFLVPSGDYLIPYLQDFTARFAVAGIDLLGIPVFSDGTMIVIPAGNFTVAEACAGLRFLVATVAFGVFYATEIYRSWIRRAIFIVLSIVVPVIANGLRAFGLIAAAQAFGSASAIEADHLTYGWVFFSLVLVALIFIGRAFADRDWATDRTTILSPLAIRPAQTRRLAIAGSLAILFASVGPAVGLLLDAPFTTTALPENAPKTGGAWQAAGPAPFEWRPEVEHPGREFTDAFTDGTTRVDRFVALYVPHGRTGDLIRSRNRIADDHTWSITARGRETVDLNGAGIAVDTAEIVSGTHRLLVWSFYALDGVDTIGVWSVKQHQIHAYLTGNSCPSAFIAIATEANDRARARETLSQFLNAMQAPNEYLCPAR